MKNSTLRHVAGLAGVTALSLMIVACGGSSSSSTPVPAPTPTNNAPIISGKIVGSAAVRQSETWLYEATVSDPDGDPVTVTTEGTLPTGMKLDKISETSYKLTYKTDGASKEGDFSATLKATDAPKNGAAAKSATTMAQGTVTADQLPTVTPVSATAAIENHPFIATFLLQDPEKDPVTIKVDTIPTPFKGVFDAAKGILTVTADKGTLQAKHYDLPINVSDGIKNRDISLPVDVMANKLPVFTSNPASLAVVAGQTWTYQVDAQDPDGDVVALAFAAPTGVTGMEFKNNTITWTPTEAQVQAIVEKGLALTITADDGFGGKATQIITLTAQQAAAPTLEILPKAGTKLVSKHAAAFQLSISGGVAPQAGWAPTLVEPTSGFTMTKAGDRWDIATTAAPVGNLNIKVTVKDGLGKDHTITKSFTIQPNSIPTVTIPYASPVMLKEGVEWTANLSGKDDDGDVVTYDYKWEGTGIQEFAFNKTTGEIKLRPTHEEASKIFKLVVWASDGYDKSAEYTVTFSTLVQVPPTITLGAKNIAALKNLDTIVGDRTGYTYEFMLQDADGLEIKAENVTWNTALPSWIEKSFTWVTSETKPYLKMVLTVKGGNQPTSDTTFAIDFTVKNSLPGTVTSSYKKTVNLLKNKAPELMTMEAASTGLYRDANNPFDALRGVTTEHAYTMVYKIVDPAQGEEAKDDKVSNASQVKITPSKQLSNHTIAAFNPATGTVTVSWTPNSGDVGSVGFAINAKDDLGHDITKTASFNVVANQGPLFIVSGTAQNTGVNYWDGNGAVPATNPLRNPSWWPLTNAGLPYSGRNYNAVQGISYCFFVDVQDPDGDDLSIVQADVRRGPSSGENIQTLPPVNAIKQADGKTTRFYFEYNPSLALNIDQYIVINAKDSIGVPSAQAATWAIRVRSDSKAAFQNHTTPEAYENQPFFYDILAQDPEGDLVVPSVKSATDRIYKIAINSGNGESGTYRIYPISGMTWDNVGVWKMMWTPNFAQSRRVQDWEFQVASYPFWRGDNASDSTGYGPGVAGTATNKIAIAPRGDISFAREITHETDSGEQYTSVGLGSSKNFSGTSWTNLQQTGPIGMESTNPINFGYHVQAPSILIQPYYADGNFIMLTKDGGPKNANRVPKGYVWSVYPTEQSGGSTGTASTDNLPYRLQGHTYVWSNLDRGFVDPRITNRFTTITNPNNRTVVGFHNAIEYGTDVLGRQNWQQTVDNFSIDMKIYNGNTYTRPYPFLPSQAPYSTMNALWESNWEWYFDYHDRNWTGRDRLQVSGTNLGFNRVYADVRGRASWAALTSNPQFDPAMHYWDEGFEVHQHGYRPMYFEPYRNTWWVNQANDTTWYYLGNRTPYKNGWELSHILSGDEPLNSPLTVRTGQMEINLGANFASSTYNANVSAKNIVDDIWLNRFATRPDPTATLGTAANGLPVTSADLEFRVNNIWPRFDSAQFDYLMLSIMMGQNHSGSQQSYQALRKYYLVPAFQHQTLPVDTRMLINGTFQSGTNESYNLNWDRQAAQNYLHWVSPIFTNEEFYQYTAGGPDKDMFSLQVMPFQPSSNNNKTYWSTEGRAISLLEYYPVHTYYGMITMPGMTYNNPIASLPTTQDYRKVENFYHQWRLMYWKDAYVTPGDSFADNSNYLTARFEYQRIANVNQAPNTWTGVDVIPVGNHPVYGTNQIYIVPAGLIPADPWEMSNYVAQLQTKDAYANNAYSSIQTSWGIHPTTGLEVEEVIGLTPTILFAPSPDATSYELEVIRLDADAVPGDQGGNTTTFTKVATLILPAHNQDGGQADASAWKNYNTEDGRVNGEPLVNGFYSVTLPKGILQVDQFYTVKIAAIKQPQMANDDPQTGLDSNWNPMRKALPYSRAEVLTHTFLAHPAGQAIFTYPSLLEADNGENVPGTTPTSNSISVYPTVLGMPSNGTYTLLNASTGAAGTLPGGVTFSASTGRISGSVSYSPNTLTLLWDSSAQAFYHNYGPYIVRAVQPNGEVVQSNSFMIKIYSGVFVRYDNPSVCNTNPTWIPQINPTTFNPIIQSYSLPPNTWSVTMKAPLAGVGIATLDGLGKGSLPDTYWVDNNGVVTMTPPGAYGIQPYTVTARFTKDAKWTQRTEPTNRGEACFTSNFYVAYAMTPDAATLAGLAYVPASQTINAGTAMGTADLQLLGAQVSTGTVHPLYGPYTLTLGSTTGQALTGVSQSSSTGDITGSNVGYSGVVPTVTSATTYRATMNFTLSGASTNTATHVLNVTPTAGMYLEYNYKNDQGVDTKIPYAYNMNVSNCQMHDYLIWPTPRVAGATYTYGTAFVTPPAGASGVTVMNSNQVTGTFNLMVAQNATPGVYTVTMPFTYNGTAMQFVYTVTVQAGPVTSNVLAASPAGPNVANGTAVTYTATANGLNNTYVWETSADGIAWATIPGATAATYSFTGSDVTKYVRVTADNTCTVDPGVVSNVIGPITWGAGAAIGTQPVAQNVCPTGTATFSFTATGTAPITYSWEMSANGTSGWAAVVDGGAISGATTNTLVINPANNAGTLNQYFRGVATNTFGTAYTNAAQLTNQAALTSTNPSNVTVISPNSATFSVTLNNPAATGQWEVSADGGGTWNPLAPPVTGATLTVTSTMPEYVNANQFRYVATDPCSGAAITTTAAVLTIVTPLVVNAIPAETFVFANAAAGVISVAATGAVSYQWQYRVVGTSTWANVPAGPLAPGTATEGIVASNVLTNTLTLTNTTATATFHWTSLPSYEFQCVVTGGGSPAQTATTNASVLKVVQP